MDLNHLLSWILRANNMANSRVQVRGFSRHNTQGSRKVDKLNKLIISRTVTLYKPQKVPFQRPCSAFTDKSMLEETWDRISIQFRDQSGILT